MTTTNIPQFDVLEEEKPLTEAERNAMRAYLQRCEVRTSTLHRIATAFVGGAGLMLLIPIFFKDVIDTLIEVLLQNAHNQFPELGSTPGIILTGLMFAFIAYPLTLSLVIPVYAIYLLLKDIIHFYFTIYMPGFHHDLVNPTFALPGITFAPDESPRIKREIMRYQYIHEHMDYMMPFSEGRRELYFDRLIENTDGHIIPPSREVEKLRAEGCLIEDNGTKDINRFNAAFGIARSLDRTLIQEVALTEMLLVRHILYLRRIVLRYAKTLLMFIWTALIAFLMLPFLHDNRMNIFLVLSIGYFVWSLSVMPIMRQPIGWIYRHRFDQMNLQHVDSQLTLLERKVVWFCYFAIPMSGIALILALASTLFND